MVLTVLMAAAVANVHASSAIRPILLTTMVLALGALSWIDVAERSLRCGFGPFLGSGAVAGMLAFPG